MPQTSSDCDLPERFGRYRIEKRIGAGAMGSVYLAEDEQLGRQVAIKTPNYTGNDSAELIERFYREARAAANLRHANICPVYDVGDIDGTYYLSMAFIDGRALSDFVSPENPIGDRKSAALVRKLALGLEHAHHEGVIHRDLKPANVMIDRQREPIILDFGLARRLDKRDESRFTQEGIILGTPAYMSPEQVEGDLDVGPRSDVYSLGVVLYELLTGHLPFEGSVTAVIGQILVQEPARPSSHRATIDVKLEAICLKMMAKNPDERYASMRDVAEALTAFLKPTTAAAAPAATNTDGSRTEEAAIQELSDAIDASRSTRALPAASSPLHRPRRRSPIPIVAVSALVVVVLLTVIVLSLPGGGTLRVEVNDEALDVRIDGKTIRLKNKVWEGKQDAAAHTLAVQIAGQNLKIGSPTEIQLPDGGTTTHSLVLRLDGVDLVSDSFTIVKGKTTVLSLTYTATTKSPKQLDGVKPNEDRRVDPPDAPPPSLVDVSNVEAGEIEEWTFDPGTHIEAMALSPDGRDIAVGGLGLPTEFRVYRIGEPDSYESIGQGNVEFLHFTPDGREIVAASQWKVEVRDRSNPQTVRWKVGGFGERLYGVVVDPLGDWVATLTQNKGKRNQEKRNKQPSPETPIQFWSLKDGQKIAECNVAPFAIRLGISPDGRYLTTNGPQGVKVLVYEVLRGPTITLGPPQHLRQRAGQNAIGIVFSPDSQFGLAYCNPNGTCRVGIWTIGSGGFIRPIETTPKGQRGGARSVAFAHGDKWILAGTRNGVLKIWDRASGQQIHSFQSPDRRAIHTALVVTPDNKLAVSAGESKVRIWRLPERAAN